MNAITDLFAADPLVIAQANRACFRPDFLVWLADNCRIWKAFETEANRIWARGRRHYSSRTIGEFLRHETALKENSDTEWKINDHVWPDLSRLYMLIYPDRALFELRGQRRAA